ncbi:MAG: hypothetical protein HUJ25_07460 [Crocinitomicaceae bacterium]|nr:hypothetical protein [Crocinitomicaceae bacterium]
MKNTSKSNRLIKMPLAIVALFMWANIGICQSTSIPNVLKLRSAKSSGAIIENDKLVGYYVFFFKEKEDRKNSTYEIQIFDDNLNAVKEIAITRPKRSYLLEIVYNEKAFILFFYDSKTGYEFITYDRNGKQLGNHKVDRKEIPRADLALSASSLNSGTENVTIFPLGSKGFVRSSYTKNKKTGYNLIAFDNKMNELWRYGSAEDSKLYESAEISNISDEVITATIYKRKGAMSKKMDAFFHLINPKDGTLIKEVPMGNGSEGKLTVLKTYLAKGSDKIILIGEYFKPGDDFLKDKSQGLFVREIDMSGNEKDMKKFSWDGDIAKFKNENLTEEDKKEAKDGFSIFFHDVIKSDGHYFLIGEQFRKQVSAGGVAMNVLAGATGGSSDAAAFEIRVSNMIVMELDESNELIDFKVVKKKRTSVYLQKGMGLYSSAFLGYYVKSTGGFDYSFTSNDKEKNKHTVVYVDANRKEEKDDKAKEKSDVMLGVIQIENGKIETQRIPINTDAKRFWFEAAKPGFVTIGEYYKKEKKLDFRLEKLTY